MSNLNYLIMNRVKRRDFHCIQFRDLICMFMILVQLPEYSDVYDHTATLYTYIVINVNYLCHDLVHVA